ncbi:hypothetical protein FJ951_27170 [Mesorhizobium sp. B2-2-3]|uniref:hypothetical protein n=1 Tax=Mesorhizobium sp. B2-2-3 TaxID=2589963 RepID=UPI001129E02E|nr:hypothetical protein [Mesorhizobium sp. B2-2-3]TPM39390.1 hypothetical protein FJ951_27170 [Mesorhizobium sp. B2-2-3]
MRISFAPQRRDDALALAKSGDVLTVNGEQFNFNGLSDGDAIKVEDIPCEFIVGNVTKIAGEVHVTIVLPHGPSPEVWQTCPGDIENVPDGTVDVPSNTWSETTETAVEGGRQLVTTTHRWHQPDQVDTVFVPDPPVAPEQEEETANVDA